MEPAQHPLLPPPNGTPLLRVLALIAFAILIAVLASLSTFWYLAAHQTGLQLNSVPLTDIDTQPTITAPPDVYPTTPKLPEDDNYVKKLSPVSQDSTGKTYAFEPLGLQFTLPALLDTLGGINEARSPAYQVSAIVAEHATGHALCITLLSTCHSVLDRKFIDHQFTIYTRSRNYFEGAGRGAWFRDRIDYKMNDLKSLYEKEIINTNGVRILRIEGADEACAGISICVGLEDGYMAAIVNLTDNPTYPGFHFYVKLGGPITMEVFDQILASFKFVQ